VRYALKNGESIIERKLKTSFRNVKFFAFGQVKHFMILKVAHVLMQKNLCITNEEAAKEINIHVCYQYSIIHEILETEKLSLLLLTLELKQPQLITCSELS
jgi:hypothetical protein